MVRIVIATWLVAAVGCHGTTPPGASSAVTTGAIVLPDGAPGIGFDDLRWSPRLGRVLVPAARSGFLDLVDPVTGEVASIAGFASAGTFDGGHDFGVTSVDDADPWLLATDRTRRSLDVIDPAARRVVASTPLASGPDYVRWVAATHEAWVTEPGEDRIEVFALSPAAEPSSPPRVRSVGFVAVPGGPESLVIDGQRRRAYTHLWHKETVAIDLASRQVVARWRNGCDDSRGIALDEARGHLFAGCEDGRATSVDVADGHQLGEIQPVEGIDVIDYSPTLHHLYLAGQASATVAFVDVTPAGELKLLGTAPTARHAHCVVGNDGGKVFVCDPDRGQLLARDDPAH